VNECTKGTANCDVNATCANTPGSFTCACNSGYANTGDPTGTACLCSSDPVCPVASPAGDTGSDSALIALPTALPSGVSGGAYRFAWPAPGNAALGLYGPQQSALTGTLLYLNSAQSSGATLLSTVALAASGGAAIDSVLVNLNPPASAVFVDSPSTTFGTGTGRYVDLSVTSPTAIAIPSGAKIAYTGSGFQYGANGRQILFVGNLSAGRGSLYYFNGTTSTLLGAGAPTSSIAFSTARTRAVVGLNISTTASPTGFYSGDLYSVDMTTGATVKLASTAVAMVAATGAPAFSLSGDGNTLVYTNSTTGEVDAVSAAASVTPTPVMVASAGKLPGVSDNGASIAFFNGTGVYTVPPIAGTTPLKIGTQTGTLVRQPRFSPDGSYVLYFESGQAHTAFPSNVWLAAPDAHAAAVKIGTNTPLQDISIGNCGDPYLLTTNLVDLTGVASYTGVGTVTLATPTSCASKTGVAAATTLHTGGVYGDVAFLKGGTIATYFGGFSNSAGFTSHAYVAPVGGTEVDVGQNVARGSLRTSSYAQRMLFLTDEATISGENLAAGSLRTANGAGTSTLLATGVVDGSTDFSPLDGRVVAVISSVAGGEPSAQITQPGIYLIPVP
jgi:hypothetical protein